MTDQSGFDFGRYVPQAQPAAAPQDGGFDFDKYRPQQAVDPIEAEAQRRGLPAVAPAPSGKVAESPGPQLAGSDLAPLAPGYNALDRFASAATLGGSDKLIAGARAIGDTLGGEPFGQSYLKEEQNQAAAKAQYQEQNPVDTRVANVAGTVLGVGKIAKVLGLGKATSLGGKALESAGLGAGVGGTSAALDATGSVEDRAKAAVEGTVFGAVLGGLTPVALGAITTGLGTIKNLVTGGVSGAEAQQQALQKIVTAFQRDGFTPDQISTKLNEWASSGKNAPEWLADAGGPNVSALLKSAGSVPGPGKAQLTQDIAERQAQAPDRLTSAVQENLTPDTNSWAARGDVLQARSANATEAYNKLFQSPMHVDPAEFAPGGAYHDLLQRMGPTGAIQQAIKTAKIAGRDPTAEGIGLDADGNPVFTRVPSWQTLENIKTALGDSLYDVGANGIRVKDTSKLGFAKEQLLKEFTDKLVSDTGGEGGLYSRALREYAGPSALLDANSLGQKLLKTPVGDAWNQVSKLSGDQLAAMRTGVASSLLDTLGQSGGVSKLLRTVVDSPNNQSRLRMAFPSSEAFDNFVSLLQREDAAQRLGKAVTPSGSVADEAASHDAGGEELKLASHAMRIWADPIWGAARFMGEKGNELLRRARGVSPDLADNIIQGLTTPVGEAAQDLPGALNRAAEKAGQSQARQAGVRNVLTGLGAAAGGNALAEGQQ